VYYLRQSDISHIATAASQAGVQLFLHDFCDSGLISGTVF